MDSGHDATKTRIPYKKPSDPVSDMARQLIYKKRAREFQQELDEQGVEHGWHDGADRPIWKAGKLLAVFPHQELSKRGGPCLDRRM
jgi:hypothetical protein